MSHANQVAKLSDKIVIPNWFDRATLEDLVDEKISQKNYEKFREWLKDTDLADEVSELVREYFGMWDWDEEG